MFDIIRIPAFKDNYIWLLRKGASAVVVDPGDARPVREALERDGLNLESILITHHHNDHQGGVAGLLEHYSAEVFGPGAESITGVSRPLDGGETIVLASLETRFKTIAVPGHTFGHLAYYGSGALFCGDTLFCAGCGRLFEGTPSQMHDSLTRLALLPDETAVFCAHEYTEANLRFALAVEPGNGHLRQRVADVAAARAKGFATVPTTIGLEKMTNPFLRCTEPEVVASAQTRATQVHNALDVFTVLREWKNSF